MSLEFRLAKPPSLSTDNDHECCPDFRSWGSSGHLNRDAPMLKTSTSPPSTENVRPRRHRCSRPISNPQTASHDIPSPSISSSKERRNRRDPSTDKTSLSNSLYMWSVRSYINTWLTADARNGHRRRSANKHIITAQSSYAARDVEIYI